MIATVEKRPLWGVDAFVHYIVLGLCSLNIVFKLYSLYQGYPLDLLSIGISLIGFSTFFLIQKGEKLGDVFFIIWIIPQLLILNQTPLSNLNSFDLSQGVSLPVNIWKHGGDETFTLGVNLIAIALFGIVLFRIRHRVYQNTIYLTSIDLSTPVQLTAQVEKIYKIGTNQRALVFNKVQNGSHYAMLTNTSDKLKFDNFGQVYSICKVNSNIVEQPQLKASDFKKVFLAKASI